MKAISLIKLPSKTELVLFLLREELKSSKLFEGFAVAGFQDSYYQPNLCAAIFGYMGFETITDDLGNFYMERLHHYTKRIGEDNEVIMKQALNFYIDLVNEKRKTRLN